MFKWLSFIWRGPKSSCTHDQNYVRYRYLTRDGCPMVNFRCKDCGLEDHGPVLMGNVPDDWEEIMVVQNGKEIYYGRGDQEIRHTRVS